MINLYHLYFEHLGGFIYLSMITLPISILVCLILKRSNTWLGSMMQSWLVWVIITNIGLIGLYLMHMNAVRQLQDQGIDVPIPQDGLKLIGRIGFTIFDVGVVWLVKRITLQGPTVKGAT